MMYVIGATRPEMFSHVRKMAPHHFFLVPGVGAQGGDLKLICEHGMNKDVGLLINASRSIIYASKEKDFANAARKEAMLMQVEMKKILTRS
jgi:orotidine-5'-phosphate decarboxylase